MNIIKTFIINHLLASASVMAAMAGALAKLDSLIALALRLAPKAALEAELDRLNGLAKAEVEKVANEPK